MARSDFILADGPLLYAWMGLEGRNGVEMMRSEPSWLCAPNFPYYGQDGAPISAQKNRNRKSQA